MWEQEGTSERQAERQNQQQAGVPYQILLWPQYCYSFSLLLLPLLLLLLLLLLQTLLLPLPMQLQLSHQTHSASIMHDWSKKQDEEESQREDKPREKRWQGKLCRSKEGIKGGKCQQKLYLGCPMSGQNGWSQHCCIAQLSHARIFFGFADSLTILWVSKAACHCPALCQGRFQQSLDASCHLLAVCIQLL